jgi:predicted nucleic acid-binding Zn ribbon protein
MKKERETKSMKDAIDAYLRANGLDNVYKEKIVLSKWEQLVGKPIALRTDYVTIKEKTLYIEMNSSVMRDELFNRKSKLIELINDEAGFEMVNAVFFK